MTTEEFRERMREAVVEHGRDEFREDVWERLAERIFYVAADFGVEGGEQPLIDCLDELDAAAGDRRQPRLLPRRAAEGVRADRHRPRPRPHERPAGRG